MVDDPRSANKGIASPDKEIAVHLSPVWRKRADFLIHADLSSVRMPGKWEQLWVRRLPNDRYELCCVPFFVPELALGDQVGVTPMGDKPHVLQSLLARSNRIAARVAFLGETEFAELAHQLIEEMGTAGCLFEWYTPGYLAIDIANRKAFQNMDKLLAGLGSAGKLQYEFTRPGSFAD